MRRATAYALTSANDRPERDPKDWRLLGSNDGGGTWTLLDERKGEVFPNRWQRRSFAIRRPAAFNTYRLEIDSVNLPALADSVQLAELEFIAPEQQHDGPGEPLDLVVLAAGENQPAESAAYAFDHRPETKWLDFASKNPMTRASWLEVRYVAAALEITNVSMLTLEQATETRRNRGVRIQAIVARVDTAAKRVELIDGSGTTAQVPLNDPSAQFKVGQSVLLTGKSAWVELRQADGKSISEPTIIEARLRLLERNPPPPPKPGTMTAWPPAPRPRRGSSFSML